MYAHTFTAETSDFYFEDIPASYEVTSETYARECHPDGSSRGYETEYGVTLHGIQLGGQIMLRPEAVKYFGEDAVRRNELALFESLNDHAIAAE